MSKRNVPQHLDSVEEKLFDKDWTISGLEYLWEELNFVKKYYMLWNRLENKG